MIFSIIRTVRGRLTAICRWRIWCSTSPLPLDDKREYHTVAGLLMEYLQHVPQVGETIEIDGYTLRTLQVDSHRVQKVQIVPPVKQDELDYEV
ncbi:hypothetical protein LNP17_21145 [Klebsiella variicola subsp. variicola]|nr:hypothetical protein [Klebsiella variicola subsp. variicola]